MSANSSFGGRDYTSVSPFLLTTEQAARFVGLSAKSLERYRCQGGGPAFIKLGPGKKARVRYRQADLDAWLDGQRFTSTSAFGAEVV